MINNLKGKGIFVFSDPGGAKPVLAFIELNNLKNYKAISDRKYKFYDEFQINVEICPKYEAKEIIDTYKPNYIFTGTSYTSSIELEFLYEAKKQKIKTYSFVDHYTRYRERFFLDGENIFPDKVFLTDDKAKRLAETVGISKYSEVIVSGNFYHEFLKNWKPKKSKNEIFSNPNNKIILFAPDPLSNINGKKIFLFDETDVWKDLSKVINKYPFQKEVFLYIKFHPNQDQSYLKKIINQIPIENSVVDMSTDTKHLIFHSDIVIGMFSSLLVEASLFGKKILRHIPNINATDSLGHLNIGEKSNNINELTINLKDSIKQGK